MKLFGFDASKFIMPEDVIKEMKNEKITLETKVGLIVLVVYMLALIIPSVFTELPGATMCNALGVGAYSHTYLKRQKTLKIPILLRIIINNLIGRELFRKTENDIYVMCGFKRGVLCRI